MSSQSMYRTETSQMGGDEANNRCCQSSLPIAGHSATVFPGTRASQLDSRSSTISAVAEAEKGF